jgi:hypothetical protein
MKRISNYKTFINESTGASTLTAEQIDFLDRCVRGTWKLNDEEFVDVDGNFDCFNKGISDFKGIKFGKVNGDFDCSYNNLSSLEGCPKEVVGHFDCSHNKLSSLEFAPERVRSSFYCSHNNLTSLEFAPERVKNSFYCQNNSLTSLDGVPKKVGGFFYFDHNEGISSETLKMISIQMKVIKSDYKTVLKSLWSEIPVEDKVLLYSSDLDWVEEDEGSKLSNLKKYKNIKKMI